jgi:single-strand DNA-binding protein
MNRAILVGNLGRDPEIRTMNNGDMVADFSLATSRRWKNKDGEKQETTQWHKVVVFGKLVQVVESYLQKGTKVAIEGEIQYRSWEKDGEKKYVTEIVLQVGGELEILSGGRGAYEDKGEGVETRRTSRSRAADDEQDRPAARARVPGRSARAAARPAGDDLDLDDEPPFDP